MAKKVSTVRAKKEKRTDGFFNIKVIKDGKVIFNKFNLKELDVLVFYFKDIENNIKNTVYSSEELYDKYKNKWDKLKLISTYIDSWGHTWKNCFLSKKVMLNYLEELISKLR